LAGIDGRGLSFPGRRSGAAPPRSSLAIGPMDGVGQLDAVVVRHRFAPFGWVSTRSRADCQGRHTQPLRCRRMLVGPKDRFDRTTTPTGMVGMSWVLSMVVVEGLSAKQVAGRLEAELGEEATGDSPSGEDAGAGPGVAGGRRP
jgi:hypothetical protein